MKLEVKYILELERIEAILGKKLINKKFVKKHFGQMEILGASDFMTLICLSEQGQIFNIDVDEVLELLSK